MIKATTVKTYRNYSIDRYTYSADVSATGKPLTMYEVYNNGTHEFINAYPALWEAICDVRWRLEKEGTIPRFEVPDFGIYALRSGVKYIENMLDRIA